MAIGDVFTFRRSVAARYRDRNGDIALAAVDRPRLDHDLAGKPLGLLVGGEPGLHDRIALKGRPAPVGEATVLHAITTAGGRILRRAHYTMDANATIDACLRLVARHRSIGAVPGFLPIRSGVVRYDGQSWGPPTLLVLSDGRALSAGGRPLLNA